MEIRKLNRDEHACTREMYEAVFSEDSKSFVDYYYSEKTKENQIYVVQEDGQMCAMIHLNPYVLMVNGAPKAANYIVAVATLPEYRRRGYMAELLKTTLQDMYRDGHLFTFLMPAAEAIYTPHDFRTVYEQQQPYITAEEMAGEEAEGAVIREAGEEDCEALAAWANETLAASYDVYARRDASYYRRLIKEYASDGGKVLVFREGDEITDCRIKVSPEDIGHKAKIMVRIVDVRRLLMSMRVRTLTAVCFQIVDPILEENNRCVVITGTEYSGILLMDAKEENSEGVVTIAALASVLFGAKTVEEICEEEGVRMTERMKEEFEKIIPLASIYLNEIV